MGRIIAIRTREGSPSCFRHPAPNSDAADGDGDGTEQGDG